MPNAFFDKTGLYLILSTGFCWLGNANAECKSFEFKAVADDYMILYVDGYSIPSLQHAFNWLNVDTVNLTCATKVIAIHGLNTYDIGGIRASDSSGYILTNSSWKCTNISYPGWESVDYDDSRWPNAVVTSIGSDRLLPGLNRNSKWIWPSSYILRGASYVQTANIHGYCRKRLAVNECALDPPYNLCNPKAGRCEDTPNGYNCHCFNGYRNTNDQTCEDIDECQHNSLCTGPTELCVNLPGSYKCVPCRNNVCNNPPQVQALLSEQNHAGSGVTILGVLLLLLVVANIALTSYLVWKRRTQWNDR